MTVAGTPRFGDDGFAHLMRGALGLRRQVPLFALFAVNAKPLRETTRANNAKGGTTPAEAKRHVSLDQPDTKWIGCPLLADGGVRTMAADDAGVVGQGIKLLANRLFKHREGTTHEIGTADGTGEEHIAHDDQRLDGSGHDEAHAAGRMTGSVPHFRPRVPQPPRFRRVATSDQVLEAPPPRGQTSVPAKARCDRARSHQDVSLSAASLRANGGFRRCHPHGRGDRGCGESSSGGGPSRAPGRRSFPPLHLDR